MAKSGEHEMVTKYGEESGDSVIENESETSAASHPSA